MIKIAVAGAAGRMGSRITALQKSIRVELAGAFEKKGHSETGKDIGTITGIGETGVKLSDSIENVIDNADVIVILHPLPLQWREYRKHYQQRKGNGHRHNRTVKR